MTKLSKEELLKYLKNLHNDLHKPPYEKCHKNQYCRKAYQQIKELIQKPKVTEEWIEEKAEELLGRFREAHPELVGLDENIYFIDTFIEWLYDEGFIIATKSNVVDMEK